MDESTEVRIDGNSLLKAVYLSRLCLTRLLLEGGACINVSNERGETPLMVACKTLHKDTQSVPKHKMIRYLLENGADPNIQDKIGKTALMHVCLEQTGVDILSLLLSSGADPTLEDHTGLSALVYAINSGNRDIVSVLLSACKAKGKEFIIITTNKLPSGHQMTKQFLNVPPPPDLDDYTSQSCCLSSHEIQLQTPTQEIHSTSGPKLLQQSQASSLTEGPMEITPEQELSFRVSGLTFQGRPPTISRHYSTDVKDATGRRCFGRKMSYDNAVSSSHSASHPNLHQGSLTFPLESSPVDENSTECLRQLNVSSLQNVVRQRNIGIDHYSSDSQLLQFGSRDKTFKNGGSAGSGPGPERHKLVMSKSSTLSGSRESLESFVQRQGAAGLERRESGALLLHHIAHTRPGCFPPLNPHAPIPDIGVSSSTSYSLSGNSKTLNGVLTGSKAFLPCARFFPRDLKAKTMLWRRHSMQSEQIKQLFNFDETLGH
uniref:Ankyrin repeat domain 34Bb n=1 Tax=Amphiprion percula TaxID=161767 RepID=A0A3P8UBX1_AMPPE